MPTHEREIRLLQAFVQLLQDHESDLNGFVRDVEDVRYCHTPLDAQQISRCEYALRNIEIKLLTLQNCIQHPSQDIDTREALVATKARWQALRDRAQQCMVEINTILHGVGSLVEPARVAIPSTRRTVTA